MDGMDWVHRFDPAVSRAGVGAGPPNEALAQRLQYVLIIGSEFGGDLNSRPCKTADGGASTCHRRKKGRIRQCKPPAEPCWPRSGTSTSFVASATIPICFMSTVICCTIWAAR